MLFCCYLCCSMLLFDGSMYCFCVNVYCTTATVCQPNWFNKFIISYHISYTISYHIISYHITCHVMSCHAMPFHAVPFHVMSCHVVSFHVTSRHVMSYHIIYMIWYHIISYNWRSFNMHGVKIKVRNFNSVYVFLWSVWVLLPDFYRMCCTFLSRLP
jgi:hypothetical protein